MEDTCETHDTFLQPFFYCSWRNKLFREPKSLYEAGKAPDTTVPGIHVKQRSCKWRVSYSPRGLSAGGVVNLKPEWSSSEQIWQGYKTHIFRLLNNTVFYLKTWFCHQRLWFLISLKTTALPLLLPWDPCTSHCNPSNISHAHSKTLPWSLAGASHVGINNTFSAPLAHREPHLCAGLETWIKQEASQHHTPRCNTPAQPGGEGSSGNTLL